MLGLCSGVKIVEWVLMIILSLLVFVCCYICSCFLLESWECKMFIVILKCFLKCDIVCGVSLIFGISISICFLLCSKGLMVWRYIFVLLLLVIFLSKFIVKLFCWWLSVVMVIDCLVFGIGFLDIDNEVS